MELYWTDEFDKGSIKAATLQKGKAPNIHNDLALNKIKDFYNQKAQGQNLPSLEMLMEMYSK